MRPGGNTAVRQSAARRVRDPLTATPESDRIDSGRTVGPGRPGSPRPGYRHARRNSDSRYQALSFKHSAGTATARVARRSRSAYGRETVARPPPALPLFADGRTKKIISTR